MREVWIPVAAEEAFDGTAYLRESEMSQPLLDEAQKEIVSTLANRRTFKRYRDELSERLECEICRTPFVRARNIQVDHDHRSDEGRGLLCRTCNLGLGHFKDNPIYLEAAAAYLRNFFVRTRDRRRKLSRHGVNYMTPHQAMIVVVRNTGISPERARLYPDFPAKLSMLMQKRAYLKTEILAWCEKHPKSSQ